MTMDTLTTTVTPIMTLRKKWYAVCNKDSNTTFLDTMHYHTHIYWSNKCIVSCSLSPLKETYVVSPSSPHLSIEDFRKQAVAIFKEYFEHGDTADVAVRVVFSILTALLLGRHHLMPQVIFNVCTCMCSKGTTCPAQPSASNYTVSFE